jgi:hypothetical protein
MSGFLKNIGKVFKKIIKSPIFKIALIAVAVYFTAGLAAGAMGSVFATTLPGISAAASGLGITAGAFGTSATVAAAAAANAGMIAAGLGESALGMTAAEVAASGIAVTGAEAAGAAGAAATGAFDMAGAAGTGLLESAAEAGAGATGAFDMTGAAGTGLLDSASAAAPSAGGSLLNTAKTVADYAGKANTLTGLAKSASGDATVPDEKTPSGYPGNQSDFGKSFGKPPASAGIEAEKSWWESQDDSTKKIAYSALSDGAKAALGAWAAKSASDERKEEKNQEREDRLRRGAVPDVSSMFTGKYKTPGLVRSATGG